MELVFQVNGDEPSPPLGVVEGYIQEGINQVTFMELVLASEFEYPERECEELIGANITLGLGDLIDGDVIWARFDGIVYEFHILDKDTSDRGIVKYQMIVRPRIWDLNFAVRSRSFENKSRTDVILELFREWDLFEDNDYKTHFFKPEDYPSMTQILQTQTSDLTFFQNLLKEGGINYFFTANRNGEAREFMKLVDNNIFFGETFTDVIPYIPPSGNPGGYRIESLETHFRATPGLTIGVANNGDGSIQTYHTRKEVEGGYGGGVFSFSVEGETDKVAKHEALTRMQHFHSKRVIFEGRSNHFAIRPGEKIKIGDERGRLEKEVLITETFHHFRQTTNSALSGDNTPIYQNLFTAVKKDMEFRPDQISNRTIFDMKRRFSQAHSEGEANRRHRRGDREGHEEKSDLEELEKASLLGRIEALEARLSASHDLSGLMIGEVIENAWVTDGNELVCKVANEKYPEGLTIKVAIGWLTTQGWQYLLPRVGVQVYFQFINGEGGQNEAVLVGYRPTSEHPVPDPSKTTDSKDLSGGEADPNDPSKDVVTGASFAPLNRHRNALQGEDGVAEIAVIDGGEDSVHINANNRICAISDKSISLSTGGLSESAGSMSQQFGKMNRKVDAEQTVNIGGKMTYTVGNNVSISSTTQQVLYANNEITLYDLDSAQFSIIGTEIFGETGASGVHLDPGTAAIGSGNASVSIAEDASAAIKVTDSNGCFVDTSSVTVKVGDATFVKVTSDTVEITGSAKLLFSSPESKMEGSTSLLLTGAESTLEGTSKTKISGGEVSVSGSIIKLNV